MSWFADEIVLLLMPLGKSAYLACLLILRPLRRENDYTQWPQKDKRKNRKEQGMAILTRERSSYIRNPSLSH